MTDRETFDRADGPEKNRMCWKHQRDTGKTCAEVAAHFGIERGQALGRIYRHRQKIEEDNRDLDILKRVDGVASLSSIAQAFGVTVEHVEKLISEALIV